jgi:N-acetylmuramoyl-L-alanine amidase
LLNDPGPARAAAGREEGPHLLIDKRPLGRPAVVAAILLGAVLAAGPARAQRATVEIAIDLSPGGARLVLTHSEQVVYAVRASKGKVEVTYGQSVRVEPSEQRIGSTVLERYRFRDGNRLIFFTGEAYRTYETFELRNPFRLIIDLQGGLSSVEQPPPATPKVDHSKTIVVIDPGHGGVEIGAVGPTGLREKEVTLDLARRLQRALQRDRSLAVVLTRDEDRLVGLDERTSIANHNRAALFLSIHLNSSSRTNAAGAETYFLSSDATDGEARTLAALENRASGVEEDEIVTYDGEKRDLDLVLWDMAQNQYMAESSLLAESMQRELNLLTGTRDRGVRQAPFRVLMGATMPAILVEVGFISNPDEEVLFRDFTYRGQVVAAMATAVREFLAEIERLNRGSRGARTGATGP